MDSNLETALREWAQQTYAWAEMSARTGVKWPDGKFQNGEGETWLENLSAGERRVVEAIIAAGVWSPEAT